MSRKSTVLGVLTLTAAMVAMTSLTASAVEKLDVLGPSCWTDPLVNMITYDVMLSQVDPAHPIKAVNMNLQWSNSQCCGLCQTDCWQLIDISPAEGWDQFGTEDCQCGDNCKCIRYSVTRALGQQTDKDTVIARLTFLVTLPLNKCCIEDIKIVLGAGASRTLVTGDVPPGYNNVPQLGPGTQTRIDREAPVIKDCKTPLIRNVNNGCAWVPDQNVVGNDFQFPIATDNCDKCNCTLAWYYKINEGCGEDGNWIKLDDPAQLVNKSYPLGCTLIAWKVVDCCGLSATCCQTVDVKDTVPPEIIAKPVPPSVEGTGTFEDPFIIVLDAKKCSWEVPDVRNSGLFDITDNCVPDPDVTQMPPPGTIWEMTADDAENIHEINISANDSNGNNATANFWYKLVDRTPPEFTLVPKDIEVPADAGKCTALVSWVIAVDDPQCNKPVSVVCDYCSGANFKIGTTKVTCTAVDWFNNSASVSFNVTVKPKWILSVQVQMKGLVSKKSFDRCCLFELADCKGNLPAQAVKGTLTFVNGVASGDLEMPTPDPCVDIPKATYDCARAKDFRHSLWSTVGSDKVGIVGTKFSAVFLGDDALRLGNLNGDSYIDILDWVIWQFKLMNPAALPAEDCSDPLPNLAMLANQSADVTGDGKISAADYGHLYVNNYQEDDKLCCAPNPMAGSSGPVTRVSVKALRGLGMGYGVAFDYNRDGYIDANDMVLSANKK